MNQYDYPLIRLNVFLNTSASYSLYLLSPLFYPFLTVIHLVPIQSIPSLPCNSDLLSSMRPCSISHLLCQKLKIDDKPIRLHNRFRSLFLPRYRINVNPATSCQSRKPVHYITLSHCLMNAAVGKLNLYLKM